MTRAPLFIALVWAAPAAAAGDARWISMDAPEVLDASVIGLQRSALALPAGFAIDTALLADAALLANAGVRWAMASGPHRFVVGARYSLFVGSFAYSAVVNGLQPLVTSYDPSFSGPSAYAVYGFSTGTITVGAELRARWMYFFSGSVTVGAALALNQAFSVIVEGGARYLQGSQFVTAGAFQPKVAAGIRLAQKGFGVTLGAVYVGLEDPLIQPIPVLPSADLCWSF